jgi:hypothetical protein
MTLTLAKRRVERVGLAIIGVTRARAHVTPYGKSNSLNSPFLFRINPHTPPGPSRLRAGHVCARQFPGISPEGANPWLRSVRPMPVPT